jgi:hypothetical protein
MARARQHRQDLLLAIECLDVALLVDGELGCVSLVILAGSSDMEIGIKKRVILLSLIISATAVMSAIPTYADEAKARQLRRRPNRGLASQLVCLEW